MAEKDRLTFTQEESRSLKPGDLVFPDVEPGFQMGLMTDDDHYVDYIEVDCNMPCLVLEHFLDTDIVRVLTPGGQVGRLGAALFRRIT